ncbi:hypothetical protein ACFOG5_24270 [Pedobacter fastidiosus]
MPNQYKYIVVKTDYRHGKMFGSAATQKISHYTPLIKINSFY